MSATRADDLAPLFITATPGVGYRRGVLTAYNSSTNANTVDLGGGVTVSNLPIINTTGLAAGQAVAILAVGVAAQSWLILGRITVPT